MSREWIVDMTIKCPYCGKHEIIYSDPTCGKHKMTLDKQFFVMFKFKELQDRIDELEKKMEEISS